MLRTFANVLVYVLFVTPTMSRGQQTGTCPEREVYNDCGTACPKTCRNYMIEIACIAVCVEGCCCQDGYVRNGDGKCVNPQQCPNNVCPENEEFLECGTACETCDNYGLIVCPDECKKGCFCREGFIRQDNGKCVKPEECIPGGCPINEEYSTCVNPCNDCFTKGNCSFLICNKGCDCRKGFYRNERFECIPESLCPLS